MDACIPDGIKFEHEGRMVEPILEHELGVCLAQVQISKTCRRNLLIRWANLSLFQKVCCLSHLCDAIASQNSGMFGSNVTLARKKFAFLLTLRTGAYVRHIELTHH